MAQEVDPDGDRTIGKKKAPTGEPGETPQILEGPGCNSPVRGIHPASNTSSVPRETPWAQGAAAQQTGYPHSWSGLDVWPISGGIFALLPYCPLFAF